MATADEARDAFSQIYETDAWEGGSGVGSAKDATVPYRAVLARLLNARDIHSVLDIGCGDWQMGSLMDWSSVSYTGVDVVPAVIEQDARRHAGTGVRFHIADARTDHLPDADLLLAKDVLQHWPTVEIQAFLAQVLSRYRYVLLTNDVASAHWPEPVNEDMVLGGWRTLDLEANPFFRPAAWRLDYDVRGEWTKRVLLYASPAARRARWLPGSALWRLTSPPH